VRRIRTAKFDRRTKETDIRGSLAIDGQGRYDVGTGIRFFDHMLELFTRHGGFDLTLKAVGDLDVDQHHTVEDVGIVLGEAVLAALGDRKGINRAGYFVMPMDETLAVVAVDLGGRPHAKVLYGRSNHHKLEAIFKCFARAMKFACSKDARLKDQLPSTKGLL